jgi:pimeloyl-ACP methyl ester carboxylesterase
MFLRLTVAFVFCASTLGPAVAQTSLHVGAAYVTRSGNGPHAVILIPGLASGAYVWEGISPSLAARYTVYAITFAGFDGEPPVQPPYFDAFTKSIEDLIAQEHLAKPILIGHSLGGALALRVAEEQPDRIGGALIVDSLPIFPPPQPGETPEQRKAQATSFRDSFLSTTPDQFADTVRRFVSYLVTDPKNVDLITSRYLRSDRATYAGAAYELVLSDLRPDLGKITAPIGLLVPADTEANAPQTVTLYTQLYAGTAHLMVTPIFPSKHFIMYDQPQQFANAVNAFLASVYSTR